MISIVAVATPAIASGSSSITVFEELPPLPNYILFLQSFSVILLVIEIPDDSEVYKLIFEITNETATASKVPL